MTFLPVVSPSRDRNNVEDITASKFHRMSSSNIKLEFIENPKKNDDLNNNLWLSKPIEDCMRTPSPTSKISSNYCGTTRPQKSQGKYCTSGSIECQKKSTLIPLISPISFVSCTESYTSMHSNSSIPVNMLSYDYLTTCQSEHTLYQIIDTLQTDHPNLYPKLLEKAHDRLYSIKKSYVSKPFSPFSDRIQSIDVASVTVDNDESSLVLSISTSLMEENETSSMTEYETKQGDLMRSMTDSYLNEEDFKVNQGIKEEESQQELNHKVENLMTQIRELEVSKCKRESSMQEKLDCLESVVKTSEEKIRELEGNAFISPDEVKSIRIALKQVQVERDNLRRQISLSKTNCNKQSKKIDRTKGNIHMPVAKLSGKSNAKRSISILQSQLSHELNIRKENEVALDKSLKQVKLLLEASKREQNSMLIILQKALGRQSALVSSLDKTQRKELVEDVSFKLVSSRNAMTALAQTMLSTEEAKDKLEDAHKTTELRADDLRRVVKKLESENFNLREQNSNLTLQLGKFKSISQDWKSWKMKYESDLEELRNQLNKGCVEKTNTADLTEQVTERDDQIHLLQIDIAVLQEELKDLQGLKEITSTKQAKKSDRLKQREDKLKEIILNTSVDWYIGKEQLRRARKLVQGQISPIKSNCKIFSPSSKIPNNTTSSVDRSGKDPQISSMRIPKTEMATPQHKILISNFSCDTAKPSSNTGKMGIREKLQKIQRSQLNQTPIYLPDKVTSS